MPKANLSKTPVTTKPTAFTIKGEELHVFAPRDAEEAKTRNVFVKDGLTYCHFNGSLSSGVLGTAGTNGLVLSYGELADKIGDLVMDAARAAKNPKARKLTIEADINVEVSPVYDGGENIIGNNVTLKVYGFRHNDRYYSTSGGMLTVRDMTPRVAPQRATKLDFF